MNKILIIKEIKLLEQLQNETIVFETDYIDDIEQIKNAVQANNNLFCIKLRTNCEITSIPLVETWQNIPLVVYPSGLGTVRDLIGMLPLLKKLNVKFFLDGALQQSYEAVQILSSLGVYSGIIINEHANWEKLTDLMYYALCGKAAHAPIEPFQYVFDTYDRRKLVDYGTVFFENEELFYYVTAKGAKKFTQRAQRVSHTKSWQRFFFETTPCAACESWRICMGKYENLKDKTLCQTFTTELLNLVESLKPLTINH